MKVCDNIRFFTGNLKVESQLQKVNKLLQETGSFSAGSVAETNKKISKLAGRLEAWNKSWLNAKGSSLNEKIVQIEFAAKQASSAYELKSSIAKHVFKQAKEISNSSVEERDIYQNHKEFYFLTNKERYLYKQIIRHDENWHFDAKIRKTMDEKIAFHTGEEVAFIRSAEEKDPANLHVIAADGVKPAAQKDASGMHVLHPTFQRIEGAAYQKLQKEKGKKEAVLVSKTFERGHYYVSLVSSKPSAHLSPIGHHSWLRLTDHEGKVSSVGKWPAEQQIRFVANIDPEFQAPESHEWIDSSKNVFEEVIEITEEQFNHLKSSIEEDMNSIASPANTYNTVLQNCADWALEKLEDNGIIEKLECQQKKKLKVNMFRVLLPTRMNFLMDDINEKQNLRFLKAAAAVIALPFKIVLRPFIRGLLLILGASSKRKGDKCILIGSLWDFLWKGVSDVTHPIPLQKYARNHFPAKSSDCTKVKEEFVKAEHASRRMSISIETAAATA